MCNLYLRLIMFILLSVVILLSSCSDYFSSPKEALEYDLGYDGLIGGWPSVCKEIGVFEVNEEYAIYFSIINYERNDEVFATYISANLMTIKEGRYHYLGNQTLFDTDILKCTLEDEEKTASTTFVGDEYEIEFCFTKTELFDKSLFDTKFDFYDAVIDFEGQTFNVTIAISLTGNGQFR